MNNFLMKEALDFLSGLTIHEGSLFIEEILGKWIDLLIDREGGIIPPRVDLYTANISIPYHWRILPRAEACWRVMFLEFHNRMLNMQIDVNVPREERRYAPKILSQKELAIESDLLAEYLNKLSITESFDWLEVLSENWATTYDRSALRDQVNKMGYSLDDWTADRPFYFLIKLLSDLTEA